MQTKYLIDGTKVFVRGTTDDKKIIISKIYEYPEDDEDLVSDDVVVVDQVFDLPPTEVIDARIQVRLLEEEEIRSRISDLYREEQRLKEEIKKNKDATKWIFDLEPFRKAKKIGFFVKDRIAPVIDELKDRKVSFSIRLSEGSIEKGLSFWFYTRNDFSQFVEMEYGIFFDPTEEDMMQRAKDRLLKIGSLKGFHIHKGFLAFIPDQMKAEFVEALLKKQESEIASRKETLKGKSDEIEKLEAELLELQSIIHKSEE